jgi:hypothetical protein
MSAPEHYVFELETREDRAKAVAAVSRALKGYVVVIRPAGRTLDQNARLHAMIAEAVKGGLATDGGIPLDEEDAKTAFVTAWMIDAGQPSDIVVFNRRPIQLRRSTKTFSREELASLMDFIEAECAQRGITLSERGQ